MGDYPWTVRYPREYQGKPQWSLDTLYISPFVARRRFDDDGVAHYDPIERNMHPTGVAVMDHFLRCLSEGKADVKAFCRIYGLRTDDLDSLIFVLTGMTGPNFRTAYQLRIADDLLRYTSLPLGEVARRSGFASHTNFSVVMRRKRKQTPTVRRAALRQRGDAGRFKVGP